MLKMLIYKPPPLHEVWLNETGRCQGKEDLLWQHCYNEELMRAQRQETQEQNGPTPCVPSPVKDIVLNGAAISDDDSAVSSICSQHSDPMMVLSTFFGLLLHQVYKMRELAQISFLREILQSMLLR
jgi:hypothetical protein